LSRYHSYLNSAKTILREYKGGEPLASFLRKYFAADKKYGSNDRKLISHLCYCFFRLGKADPDLPVEERIALGLFLCSTEPNKILEALKPEWNEKINLPLQEKLLSVNYQLSSVLPWKDELSNGIEFEKFCESFFTQPDLFIRIRPHHAEAVLLKLGEAGVDYEFISPFTVRLPNSFQVDKYFVLDKQVVIQDYNSQRVAEFFPVRPGRSDRVWDCCAGSGGKSIMAYDLNPNIELTVSDVRESILINLKKRFAKAGVKHFRMEVTDLEKPVNKYSIFNNQYSIIIADVPCSGSGTWSRTPEQLCFFEADKLTEYAALQKRILTNIIPHIKPGGYLLYITCSVYKAENEDAVGFIMKNFPLKLLKMNTIKGYEGRADTMFAALLQLHFQSSPSRKF
jgi:16S rRNA (cytosine967-C5)-methyltransferase